MKKMLSILGAIGLTATASMAVVACQVEIKGDTLKDLANKFNEGQKDKVVAMSDVNLKTPSDLKNDLIQKLTSLLVNDYDMDSEGYLLDSKISDIVITNKSDEALVLMSNGELMKAEQDNNGKDLPIAQEKLSGISNVKITVEGNEFDFQINFVFSN